MRATRGRSRSAAAAAASLAHPGSGLPSVLRQPSAALALGPVRRREILRGCCRRRRWMSPAEHMRRSPDGLAQPDLACGMRSESWRPCSIGAVLGLLGLAALKVGEGTSQAARPALPEGARGSVHFATTGNHSEVRTTVPIARRKWARKRVVMSWDPASFRHWRAAMAFERRARSRSRTPASSSPPSHASACHTGSARGTTPELCSPTVAELRAGSTP